MAVTSNWFSLTYEKRGLICLSKKVFHIPFTLQSYAPEAVQRGFLETTCIKLLHFPFQKFRAFLAHYAPLHIM